MTAIIATQGLKKTFKTREGEVQAVKGVDLHVDEGQIFGFLGPNGAGKSTTMRMLTTLLTPDGGSATIVGYDLLLQPAHIREYIGYVSQSGGASSMSTGYENLILQGQLYGMKRAEADKRAQAIMTALELTPFANRLVRTYSGGQRRRLDLALGMMHQPRLLFLDEPTTGLDPQSRAHLWDEIRRLRAQGTTIFLTTHYLDEADTLCDYLAVMDGGQVIAEGAPAALKRKISGDQVRLGVANRPAAQALLEKQPYVLSVQDREDGLFLYVNDGDTALPELLRLLDNAQLSVQTISMAHPSLDDVFLQLTGRSLRENAN
jgi:ABC-2 type transport system ATP-binding protein